MVGKPRSSHFQQAPLEDLILTYEQVDEIHIYENRVKQ